MIDNSDLQQKINIRARGMSIFPCSNPKIVDLYAGEGNISNLFWKHYSDNIFLIEKEKGKANKISFGTVIIGDNKRFLDLTKDADIVDADAYGLVFSTIKKVVDISEKKKIIFFTESNPFTKSIHKTIEQILELKPIAFWVEKANNSSVFYGYLIY